MTPDYDEPFKVFARTDDNKTVFFDGRQDVIAITPIKPIYIDVVIRNMRAVCFLRLVLQ